MIVFGQGKEICGQTELSIKELTECGDQNRWYNIDWQGNVAGQILLACRFLNKPQEPPMQQVQQTF